MEKDIAKIIKEVDIYEEKIDLKEILKMFWKNDEDKCELLNLPYASFYSLVFEQHRE